MSIKLLFADDSVTMHKVIQLTLESEDIDLRVANDGKEALAAVGEEKPDVLIAEVAMPVMNGFELCRQIKDSPQTKHIPVILISGELEEYDEELGATVGADAHITKPFKSSEFIETVKQMAEIREKAGMAESLVETGQTNRTENGGRPDGITGQGELLELTPSQSAGSAMPQKTDAEPDEEFEVIGDDTIDLDDDIEDESEDDILSDSLEIDGVELDLEGMEDSSTGSDEAGQSVDDDLDSVFKGLGSKDEMENESPAAGEEMAGLEETIPDTTKESEDAAQAEEPREGEADGILDEVFKDEEIDLIDSSGEELGQADAEPEIVVDLPETEIVEAGSGEAVLDGLEEEQVALDEPEAYAEPVVDESPVMEKAVGAGSEEVLSDSIRENVRLFFETKAETVLREVLSESVDKQISGALENRLEEMVKDEIKSAVGKSLESAMPAMLKAVTEITSEITPRIAEEMIKIAIEQITKGDADKPSV